MTPPQDEQPPLTPANQLTDEQREALGEPPGKRARDERQRRREIERQLDRFDVGEDDVDGSLDLNENNESDDEVLKNVIKKV